MLKESRGHEWAAVCVNETWHEGSEELDVLETGCCWRGSGGSAGEHGVGILLSGNREQF